MKPNKQVQNMQPSYIREILAAAKSNNMISLAGGLPDSEHLPIQPLLMEMHKLASIPEVFQYGETIGYQPLIDFLTSKYQLPTATSLMITNGSQQGLDLIARTFIDQGAAVVMEAPSYLGAIQTFGLAQANIQTVEQNNDGPDLNQLEHLFVSAKPKLFYTVPDFHNPTGVCWSLDIRKEVARLCQKHEVVLIEDAPYRELRFTGKTLPMVSTFCQDQSIILRSYSKTTAPGIRLGSVYGPIELIKPMLKVKQAADLHTGQPMQAALLGLLSAPNFGDHLARLQGLYASRFGAISEALVPLIGMGCHLTKVEGGMFVWLSLVNGNPSKIAESALKNQIAVVPSDVFYLKENAAPALRLNYSHSNERELTKAIEKLTQVIALASND